MAVTPFRIDVPQAVLDDLAERLARTRWPAAAEGAVDVSRTSCEPGPGQTRFLTR